MKDKTLPRTKEELDALWEAFWVPEEKRMRENNFSDLQILMLKSFGGLAYTAGMQEIMDRAFQEVKQLGKDLKTDEE